MLPFLLTGLAAQPLAKKLGSTVSNYLTQKKADAVKDSAIAKGEQDAQAAYQKQQSEYEKKVASINSAPYADDYRDKLLSQVKAPVAPTSIRSAYSWEQGNAKAQGIDKNTANSLDYYTKLQGKPLTADQLRQISKGETPTLDTNILNKAAAVIRDTIKPTYDKIQKANTDIKFTNPALYRDNEVDTFKEAQTQSNASGANAAWDVYQWLNPTLRGMSKSIPAVSNAVGAVAGEGVKEKLDPAVNAFYKYNPKYVVGNVVTGATQKAADLGVNLATGGESKNVGDYIQNSKLSDAQKELYNTAYQAGTGILGSYVQGKASKAYKKASDNILNDADALRAGWETFKKTGSLDSALDAHDALLGKNFKATGKGVQTQGFRSPEIKPIPASKIIKERQMNVGKFSSDKVVQGQVKQKAKDLGLDTYMVKSFKDMEAEANAMGAKDIKDILKKSKNGLVSAEENMQLTQIINEQIQVQKKLKEQGFNDTASLQKIALSDRIIDAAMKKQVQGGTAVARSLVSNRYLANITLDPIYWIKRAESKGGSRVTDDVKAKITELANNGDRSGLAALTAQLEQPTAGQKISSLYKASLLFNPKTHLRNITANVAQAGLETVKDIPATAIDKVASLFTGKRSTTITPSTIAAKIKGIGKGIADAREVLRTGMSPLDAASKFEVPSEISFNNKVLDATVGKFVRGSGRALNAEDALAKRPAYEESLMKQAQVQAKNEKLTGKNKVARVKDLFKMPTEEMKKIAIKDAEKATFQQDSYLANALQSVENSSPIARLATNVVMPFKKTPINVVSTGLEYSPLGVITPIVKSIASRKNGREYTQKEAVESLGRSATGSGLMALGAYLASQGLVSPSAPSDKRERDMYNEENRMPQAFVNPATGWQYDTKAFGVPGNQLAAGADLYDVSRTNPLNTWDGLTTAAGRYAKQMTDQSFLQGVSRGVNALVDPNRSAGTFFQSAVGGVVPPLVNAISTASSPGVKKTGNLIDYLQSRVPWARDDLPNKIGIFGEPVRNSASDTGWASVFDITSAKKIQPNEIIQGIKDAGTSIGLPSGTVAGIKMTPKELELYQTISGQTLSDVLGSVMSSNEYKSLSQGDQQKLIDKSISTVRDIANQEVFGTLYKERMGIPAEVPSETVLDIVRAVTSNSDYKDLTPSEKDELLSGVLQDTVSAFQQLAQQTETQSQIEQINILQQQAEQQAAMEDLQAQLNQQRLLNQELIEEPLYSDF